jgi:hypothetical protein
MVRPGRVLCAAALSTAVVLLSLSMVPLPSSPMTALATTTVLPVALGAVACFALLRDEPWTVVAGLSAVVAAVPAVLGVVARSAAGASSMVLGSLTGGVVMAGVHAFIVIGLGYAVGSSSRELDRL